MTIEDPFSRYKNYLETLTAAKVSALPGYVSPAVLFSDPFHDVEGVAAMVGVFDRLFQTVSHVQFIVLDHAFDGQLVFFRWRLTGRLSGKDWELEGVTHLTFDDAGLVLSHREYWDAAAQLYELFPVIGPLLRYFRGRIAGA